jgi:Arc-like DNA binding domain
MSGSRKKVGPKKKGPGRPYTGGRDPLFSLRMPPEIREQLEKQAREDGVTMSKALLKIITAGLAKKKDTK